MAGAKIIQHPNSAPNSDVPTHEELDEYFRDHSINGMIGLSGKMQEVNRIINAVGPTDAYVLIVGENGTGKELVARALHSLYKQGSKPFVGENCGALPPELLESILFGHKKGAFTGAIKDHTGLFQMANHGVIFLDEIGELSPYLQVKLLRVLQEHEVMPLGGSKVEKLEIRVISATNSDLATAISESRFREDLYFRLNVVQLSLPPLRERGPEDIRMLVDYYHKRFSMTHGKYKPIAEDGYAFLQSRIWPGNIRELSNFIERAVILHNNLSPMNAEYFSLLPIGEYEKQLEGRVKSALSPTSIGSSGVEGSVNVKKTNNSQYPASAPVPSTSGQSGIGSYAEDMNRAMMRGEITFIDARDNIALRLLHGAFEENDFKKSKTANRIGISRKYVDSILQKTYAPLKKPVTP